VDFANINDWHGGMVVLAITAIAMVNVILNKIRKWR
jgi:hypothetical protein